VHAEVRSGERLDEIVVTLTGNTPAAPEKVRIYIARPSGRYPIHHLLRRPALPMRDTRRNPACATGWLNEGCVLETQAACACTEMRQQP
jgi:hypothetical protein